MLQEKMSAMEEFINSIAEQLGNRNEKSMEKSLNHKSTCLEHCTTHE
jgi:hypothetical protein